MARVAPLAEVGSAELQHDPARLEALSKALDRLVGGAAPELRRLRLVFEVFLREWAHALGRVDQQAADSSRRTCHSVVQAFPPVTPYDPGPGASPL